MALTHATPGTPIDVHPTAPSAEAGRSVALFKSRDLEVIRLVLRRGEGLPPHQVPGELVLQCLQGELRVQAGGTSSTLRAGQLLWLDGGLPHAVEAVEDACGLLTIALVREPGTAPDGGPKPLQGGPVDRA